MSHMTSPQRTINIDEATALEARYEEQCEALGLIHMQQADWNCEPGVEALDIGGDFLGSNTYGSGRQLVVWKHELGLAKINSGHGRIGVEASGATALDAWTLLCAVREILPQREVSDGEMVPVGFWSATQHGGRRISRDIDTVTWEAIRENYPRSEELAAMMSPDFRPGLGGQLLLWHGVPGTGKTTALRALAREWRGWCDINYIVDPDVFFGPRADYMMEVLTSEDDMEFGVAEADPKRWRLLVLEDCGELLAPDARQEVGQALSRLLNACDGLIGRGLRLMVLVTTNEPLERMHEAVARPGRCAARVEFGKFSSIVAVQWLRDHGYDGEPTLAELYKGVAYPTLAELYGRLEGFRKTQQDRQAIGFA